MVYSIKLLIFLITGIILLAVGIIFFVTQIQDHQEIVAENLPEYFEAPEFELINCTEVQVTNADLKGTVWLVDFIFTRCTGPCPIMTQKMVNIQKALKENALWPEVKLVSISVDPEYDTPQILKEYADKWGADTEAWFFLTGPADSTLQLIREGFNITAQKESSEHMGHGMPNILHNTSFLLIDQSGIVRKILALDEPDLPELVVEFSKKLISTG
jgi:protein SCO1/2